ncbi:MAG: hypothetical protein ACM3UU_06940 [Ignavibacteriales bacterium]
MKKLYFYVFVIIFVFILPALSLAQPQDKEIPVMISATSSTVKCGEVVMLTAAAEKHGSSFEDSWSEAEKLGTEYDESTGKYISNATFVANNAGIYNIKYFIRMKAGKSETYFNAAASYTINVINPITVVGAEIRNISIKPVIRPDGSISVYSASGDAYVLWSDGTSTSYGKIYFFFGAAETSKKVSVSLNINSKVYSYQVVVTR